jgi:hypothetical protein
MTIESQLNNLITQTDQLDQTVSTELVDVNDDISAVRTRVTNLEILLGAVAADGGGVVNRVTAGAGISISPPSGKGYVTITNLNTGTGTGGGTDGGTGGGTDGGTGGGTGGGTDGGTSYIEIVDILPTDGNYVGRTVVYLGVLYVWDGTTWVTLNSTLTPDAPDSIAVVDTLPTDAADGTVVFLTLDGFLYQRVNGVWVQVVVNVNTSTTVADASITVAKFAQGLRPVEILNALPTTGNTAGRLVFLTTDNKLYRFDGTSFVSNVNTTDLVGTIGADQIAANAITTGKIQVGAVNAAQIAAGAINTAQLAAGSVTADKIVVNSVTADKIAANAITTDKLAANAITAGKIAAGAIGTSQLAAQAITSDKLATNTLITASAQIASGIITTAKINDAAVNTLKIGANAVTVPVRFNYGNLGSTATTLTGSFTLPDAANCLLVVSFTLNNDNQYYNNDTSNGYQIGLTAAYPATMSTNIAITIDGTQVFSEMPNHGFGYVASIASSKFISTAGTKSFSITFTPSRIDGVTSYLPGMAPRNVVAYVIGAAR